jgi:Putative restriction endonuclease
MATVTERPALPTISELREPATVPSIVAEPAPLPMPTSMPALTLYRMSFDLYERIAELELLRSSDHVVLLDGLLVNQMTKGHLHNSAVLRGQEALRAAIPAGWHVRPEQSVALLGGPDGDSAPEPDLAVIFGNFERYDNRLPNGSEIGLVIEVSSSPVAIRIDRAGLPRYAHAGIPIACIVNIPDRSVEVYSEPSGPSADPGYRRFETLGPGQTLAGEIGNAETGPAALAPIGVEAFFAPN